MTDAPTRYPLAWPRGRARRKYRGYGKFRSDGRQITVSTAVSRLNQEAERLGALYPLLSTDFPTRLDGSLVLNRGAPSDPGAVLYFQLEGKPFALACDTYDDVAQNIAALAAHIEATRAIARYGVASAAETLEAFSALPPPNDSAPRARPWWQVLGFQGPDGLEQMPAAVRETALKSLFSALARKHHPDAGGSDQAMAELNAARDAAMRILEGLK